MTQGCQCAALQGMAQRWAVEMEPGIHTTEGGWMQLWNILARNRQ